MILDGNKVRDELIIKYKDIISKDKLDISLGIIQVGNNEESNLYIKNKIKYCEMVGIKVLVFNLNSEEEVIDKINELNNDDNITGIILQSPTEGMDFDKLVNMIDYKKDVDGLTKNNIYNLYNNNDVIIPCTVKGIFKLLDYYNININNKKICIIGRSNIVSKPLLLELINRDCTVSICHSKTDDLSCYTKNSDVIISCVGKSKLITKDMVNNNFIGIDVGISKINKKIVGDFDFDNLKDKSSYITPVPGGIGPMTVAMIIDNLIYMKKEFDL